MEVVGPLQIQVLDVLWSAGQGTVFDIALAINGARKAEGRAPLAYTTFLTVARNLAKRQLVLQLPGGGRSHIFKPLQTAAEYRTALSRYFVGAYFGGSRAAFDQAHG